MPWLTLPRRLNRPQLRELYRPWSPRSIAFIHIHRGRWMRYIDCAVTMTYDRSKSCRHRTSWHLSFAPSSGELLDLLSELSIRHRPLSNNVQQSYITSTLSMSAPPFDAPALRSIPGRAHRRYTQNLPSQIPLIIGTRTQLKLPPISRVTNTDHNAAKPVSPSHRCKPNIVYPLTARSRTSKAESSAPRIYLMAI